MSNVLSVGHPHIQPPGSDLPPPGFISSLMVQILTLQPGDFPIQWLDGSLWLCPVRRQVTTSRNWVKMVKIQVRSVLFFAAGRARMRSGDQFSVCFEFLPSGLKKEKPKDCGFPRASARRELSTGRAPGWLTPSFH